MCGLKIGLEVLRGVLPARYSPLQLNGNGNQGLYLAELSTAFAEVLIGLIGPEAPLVITHRGTGAPS